MRREEGGRWSRLYVYIPDITLTSPPWVGPGPSSSLQDIHVLIILSPFSHHSGIHWPSSVLRWLGDWETDQGKFIEMRLLMERRGREQFVREISTQNWQDGYCLPSEHLDILTFLLRKKNSAFVWLSQPQCLADCITFILMISRSPGRSWQLKTEGWPQKRKAFLFLNTKKGKLRTLPFSDERIDMTCVEKLIFMFLTVTYRACGICIIYRLACKLFSFQLATNLRSKKALITSLN